MTQIFQIFTVDACPNTGEWVTAPQDTGRTIEAAEWHRKTDTHDVHHDVIDTDKGMVAVQVNWVE